MDGSLPPVNSAFSASSAGKKKTSGRIDDTTFAEIQSMELNLSSSNWRERCNGVEQLQQLAESNPAALSSCLTKVTLSINSVYLFSLYLFYLFLIYLFINLFLYFLFIYIFIYLFTRAGKSECKMQHKCTQGPYPGSIDSLLSKLEPKIVRLQTRCITKQTTMPHLCLFVNVNKNLGDIYLY